MNSTNEQALLPYLAEQVRGAASDCNVNLQDDQCRYIVNRVMETLKRTRTPTDALVEAQLWAKDKAIASWREHAQRFEQVHYDMCKVQLEQRDKQNERIAELEQALSHVETKPVDAPEHSESDDVGFDYNPLHDKDLFRELSEPVDAWREIKEWHEDYGAVLWAKVPVDEPYYFGSPLDSDWPDDYYTHFLPSSLLPKPPQSDKEGA